MLIRASKRRCWQELCSEVDQNPWGRPYKTVMVKLKSFAAQPPSCPALMGRIVTGLFLEQHETAPQEDLVTNSEMVPLVTSAELLEASRRIGNSKAPGPDGIPNVALKAAIRAKPNIFLALYNACLMEGVFPRSWKTQRLVLLPKGKKPPAEPSSYRPLCMLDTAGKILERIIYNRLEKAVEQARGLAEHQYGFRKARSTIDAVKVVVDTAQQAIAGKRWKGGAKQYCAIITLDVKNAFNSARWDNIHEKMRRLQVPGYIRRILADYLKDRILRYDTSEGIKEHRITGGVPQGSVLGPLLWNVMYDDVLGLPVPEGVKIVGFADDVAVVVVAKHLEEITRIGNKSIDLVQDWLLAAGLQLAAHKTEAVLVTGRKKRETITLSVGSHEIGSKPFLKYLGVMIDARLSFKDHLAYVSHKAANINAALSRIMPNVGGPRYSRRRLLASMVTSVMMYAAPVWADAVEVASFKRGMQTVQRLCALRVISAYRTVSYDAALVIAGLVPFDLLAAERRKLYYSRDNEKKGSIEVGTLQQWQQKWSGADRGRWTHRLIPYVRPWIKRKHGEVDFHLTQMLTGHGCFRAYLHRFKLESSPECPNCRVPEDAEHVVFQCDRFKDIRWSLEVEVGEHLTPESLVPCILSSDKNWRRFQSYTAELMKNLRQIERERNSNSILVQAVDVGTH